LFRSLAAADVGESLIGEMLEFGDRVLFPHAARVDSAGTLLGYVVRWQSLTGTEEDRDRLQDLIGPGTEVRLANLSGDVWTDLVQPAEPLAMDLTASEAVTVTGTGGRELIAASTPITGVPWAVIVDISVAQALSDVDDVLGWLLL